VAKRVKSKTRFDQTLANFNNNISHARNASKKNSYVSLYIDIRPHYLGKGANGKKSL